MKVLFIASIGEKGGATKSLLTLVKLLKEKGVDATILTPKKDGLVMNYCKQNNIDVLYLKYYKMSYSLVNSKIKNLIKIIMSPIYGIFTYFANKIAINKLGSIINMEEYNFVHTNLTRDEIGIMISKKYGIPHIIHLREYGDIDFNCKYMRINFYKYLNDGADVFMAISKSIKNYFIKKGLDRNKIVVIYNGIEKERIVNRKREIDDLIKIVISGTISHEKGQIQVIKAMKFLNNPNIHLYLYGSGEKKYIEILRNYINKFNLDKQVHFLGYVNNIESELSQYDIGIMSSKNEAFGRVTIEYMLSKIPVIASNTGANGEIIINNECGLIYNYNDINDLCEKIQALVSSKELRKKLSINGYNRAIEFFLAQKNACEVFDLYKHKIISKN